MNLIVAVDKKWGIGYKGELLASVPDDMRHFREMTSGKIVIMGRKTLESMPNGRPLPFRRNIVISKQDDYRVEGAEVVKSIEDALMLVSKYDSKLVFVIGGETIYRQMLDYCNVAYITKFDKTYDADTFFPNLDENSNWECVDVEDVTSHKGLDFSFCKYVRT